MTTSMTPEELVATISALYLTDLYAPDPRSEGGRLLMKVVPEVLTAAQVQIDALRADVAQLRSDLRAAEEMNEQLQEDNDELGRQRDDIEDYYVRQFADIAPPSAPVIVGGDFHQKVRNWLKEDACPVCGMHLADDVDYDAAEIVEADFGRDSEQYTVFNNMCWSGYGDCSGADIDWRDIARTLLIELEVTGAKLDHVTADRDGLVTNGQVLSHSASEKAT